MHANHRKLLSCLLLVGQTNKNFYTHLVVLFKCLVGRTRVNVADWTDAESNCNLQKNRTTRWLSAGLFNCCGRRRRRAFQPSSFRRLKLFSCIIMRPYVQLRSGGGGSSGWEKNKNKRKIIKSNNYHKSYFGVFASEENFKSPPTAAAATTLPRSHPGACSVRRTFLFFCVPSVSSTRAQGVPGTWSGRLKEGDFKTHPPVCLSVLRLRCFLSFSSFKVPLKNSIQCAARICKDLEGERIYKKKKKGKRVGHQR